MDNYGCHELLDRVYIIAEMLDTYVLSHPDITPQWQAQAVEAQSILFNLYHTIGCEHIKQLK